MGLFGELKHRGDKNEILKDIKKETARNENVVAFWVAVLGH